MNSQRVQSLGSSPQIILSKRHVNGGIIKWNNKLVDFSIQKCVNLRMQWLDKSSGPVLKNNVYGLIAWDSGDGFHFDTPNTSYVCSQGKWTKAPKLRLYDSFYINRLGQTAIWKGRPVVAYPAIKHQKRVLVMAHRETGELIGEVNCGNALIEGFGLIPQRELLISSTLDGYDLDFWHLEGGYLKTWPVKKEDPITSLSGGENSFFTGMKSGKILAFSTCSKEDYTLNTESKVTSLKKQGQLLISGHQNGSIKIWDLNMQKAIRSFSGPAQVFSCYFVGKSALVAHFYEKGPHGRRYIWKDSAEF